MEPKHLWMIALCAGVLSVALPSSQLAGAGQPSPVPVEPVLPGCGLPYHQDGRTVYACLENYTGPRCSFIYGDFTLQREEDWFFYENGVLVFCTDWTRAHGCCWSWWPWSKPPTPCPPSTCWPEAQ